MLAEHVQSGGSQPIVGVDYRLTTVLVHFKHFYALFPDCRALCFRAKRKLGALIYKASSQ